MASLCFVNKRGQKSRVNFRVKQNLLTRLDPNTSSRVIARSIPSGKFNSRKNMAGRCFGRVKWAICGLATQDDAMIPSSRRRCKTTVAVMSSAKLEPLPPPAPFLY